MAQALLLTDETQKQIDDLVAFARANVFTNDKLLKLANGIGKPPGDDPNFSMIIPAAFRVVFTIEEQQQRLAKHISISYRDRLPAPLMVDQILEKFGFKYNLKNIQDNKDKIYVWPENNLAINVLEFE